MFLLCCLRLHPTSPQTQLDAAKRITTRSWRIGSSAPWSGRPFALGPRAQKASCSHGPCMPVSSPQVVGACHETFVSEASWISETSSCKLHYSCLSHCCAHGNTQWFFITPQTLIANFIQQFVYTPNHPPKRRYWDAQMHSPPPVRPGGPWVGQRNPKWSAACWSRYIPGNSKIDGYHFIPIKTHWK